MTPEWTPEDEERLRQALREEASRMLPSADGLDRIRARIGRVPFWNHPALLGVAAATATAVVAIGVVYGALRGPSDDATLSPGGNPTTTTTTPRDAAATDETPGPDEDQDLGPVTDAPDLPGETIGPPAPEPKPNSVVTVPVYYVADTPAGARLAREWRSATSVGTAAETAVATMLTDPLDPDYRTLWNPSMQVSSIEIREGAVEVDLDIPAGATVPPDEAELAVQQLVYTVTAAFASAGEDPPPAVRMLVDGELVGDLLGVDLSGLLDRDPQLDVRQLVQLNDPTEGDTMDRRPVFTGEAAVFEATVDWVIEQDGQVVQRGFTTTEEGQKFSRFSFSPDEDLEPGVYVIRISEQDASDGEGREVMADTRSFTVAD